MMIGGYDQIPKLLSEMKNVKIQKKFVVTEVGYNNAAGEKAYVKSANGEIVKGDVIVNTMPIGVLKMNDVTYNPPLPDWKVKSIQTLGFGVLNKVITICLPRLFLSLTNHFGISQRIL